MPGASAGSEGRVTPVSIKSELLLTDEVTARERAAEERESAQSARKIAEHCQREAETIGKTDYEMAASWARCAEEAAGLAFGHMHRAGKALAGSREATEARGHAEAAQKAAERARMACAHG